MDNDLRKRVINLAAKLAQQESEESGQEYTKCISKALDEACLRLGVNRNQFIKMFI